MGNLVVEFAMYFIDMELVMWSELEFVADFDWLSQPYILKEALRLFGGDLCLWFFGRLAN